MESVKQWHDLMPALYRAELDTMQNAFPWFSLESIAPFTDTNGHLSFTGTITLESGELQPVLVVFPHAYPYCPPEVFPLAESGGPVNGILNIRSFGRGNQFANGRICLFREEEVWVPFQDSIGSALHQAKRWLEAALSPTGFTEGLVVKENNSPLPHLGQVLFSFRATPPDSAGGLMLLSSFKENNYSLLQIQCNTPEGTVTVESIPEGTPLSPARQQYTYGRWFKVESFQDIVPFLNPHIGLAAYLMRVLQVDINDLLKDPSHKAKRAIIGFRERKSKLFHFIQLSYWREGSKTRYEQAYLLGKNLQKELFVRVNSLFDVSSLANKRILIVGLGSIGSEVAIELAAIGLGNFTLIDPETFEAGNSVRHAADLLMIGENKVEVVKKLIQSRNPLARVKAIASSIFTLHPASLHQLLFEADVVLDLTANRLVESYFEEALLPNIGAPFVQAAVSMGGLTGTVQVVAKGKTPCLRCLRERKLSSVPVSALSTKELAETEPDFGPCSIPALPASGLDSRAVALQAARVTMQLLLQTTPSYYPPLPGYQYYWHGPAGSVATGSKRMKKKPFDWDVKSEPLTVTCTKCTQAND